MNKYPSQKETEKMKFDIVIENTKTKERLPVQESADTSQEMLELLSDKYGSDNIVVSIKPLPLVYRVSENVE
jgi:hypothetical protein